MQMLFFPKWLVESELFPLSSPSFCLFTFFPRFPLFGSWAYGIRSGEASCYSYSIKCVCGAEEGDCTIVQTHTHLTSVHTCLHFCANLIRKSSSNCSHRNSMEKLSILQRFGDDITNNIHVNKTNFREGLYSEQQYSRNCLLFSVQWIFTFLFLSKASVIFIYMYKISNK